MTIHHREAAPSLSPNPVVGSSERHRFSNTISIIRILFCLAVAGCSQSDEPTASTAPVEFVFPLEAGTTWHYTYSWSHHSITGLQTEQIGHQVWRSIGPETPNAVKILATRIDTTRTWMPYVGSDTTTQITQVDTSFLIIVTPDSLYIQWYQLARHGYWSEMQDLFRIPRRVESNTDSLSLSWGAFQSSYLRATYVAGKGLTSWEDYNSSNYFWNERLIFESMSP